MAPLQDFIHAYDLKCMFYADDTQNYIAITEFEHSVDLLDILQT